MSHRTFHESPPGAARARRRCRWRAFAGAAEDVEAKRTGGPYVPTPQVVVDEMLRIGKVGPNDFVIDLGSGDGVIVLTAAQKLKARGFGVDIDPELVKLSNNEAKKRGVADRASFQVQDVFKADISKATVVTLYLLPGMMMNLRPKIFNELKPGTRVVSHDYHFDDWRADDQYHLGRAREGKDKRRAARDDLSLDHPREDRRTLAGASCRQRRSGGARVEPAPAASRPSRATDAQGRQAHLRTQLSGENISFTLPTAGGRQVFKGRVDRRTRWKARWSCRAGRGRRSGPPRAKA